MISLVAIVAAFQAPPMSSKERQMRAAHLPSIMEDLFRPVGTERAPAPARLLSGRLPADLQRGALLKNGPNAQPFGEASGGWLDGDGLVHCIVLPPDEESREPTFSRTFLRTQGFAKEEAAGKALFDGTLVAPDGAKLLVALAKNALVAAQPQKDTANTAFLRLDNGRCFALMEQCLPTELSVARSGEVQTVRAMQDFEGRLLDRERFPFAGGALTAHFKVDPVTRESIGVTYCSNGPPGAKIEKFDESGNLCTPSTFVPLNGPAQTMIHDCAITQARNGPANTGAPCGGGYVVILDFALTIRPVRMLRNDFPVEYEPSAGARIGLVPRQGSGAEAAAMGEPIWAEVDPCVVLHTMNAYERADGTVAITALRSEPRTPQSFIESYTTALLHEWVIDPTDGGRCVGERCLSDVPLEFPTIDPRLVGSECKFGFCITPRTIGGPNRYGPPFEGILIDGVAKVDLQSGGLAAQWTAPEGWWVVSEATFVPKLGSAAGLGDEGYLLVFTSQAREVAEGTAEAEDGDGRASRLYVLDGAALGDEARAEVAVLELPAAVPYGLHSVYVPYEELRAHDRN